MVRHGTEGARAVEQGAWLMVHGRGWARMGWDWERRREGEKEVGRRDAGKDRARDPSKDLFLRGFGRQRAAARY